MSHLSDPMVRLLTRFLRELDARIQDDLHAVSRARQAHVAFRRRFVVMTNLRALVCDHACAAALVIDGATVHELGSGGWDLTLEVDGQMRVFRWKKAEVDRYGRLVVTTDSDSFLAKRLIAQNPQRSLFETYDEEAESAPAPVIDDSGNEVWVLAYLLDPSTLSLARVIAAWASGFVNTKAPYKLVLEDLIEIDLATPTPPSFPQSDDDLFDDGAEEERDEGFGA